MASNQSKTYESKATFSIVHQWKNEFTFISGNFFLLPVICFEKVSWLFLSSQTFVRDLWEERNIFPPHHFRWTWIVWALDWISKNACTVQNNTHIMCFICLDNNYYDCEVMRLKLFSNENQRKKYTNVCLPVLSITFNLVAITYNFCDREMVPFMWSLPFFRNQTNMKVNKSQ